MPGESPAVFGDALRRLAGGGDLPLPGRPALLVLDPADCHQAGRGPRRAAQARPGQGGAGAGRAAARRPAQDGRLRARPSAAALGRRRARRPRRAPGRAGVEHPYSKEPGSAAETAAKAILESRGNAPRLYRNTLVFLAADKARLQDLDEAVRRYLAWESIVAEKETLNLDPHQVKQAETQKQAADGAVTARLPETYQWLLVPVQANPQAPVEWQAIRLSGQDALAVRASKKLRSDELLVDFARPTILRMELDECRSGAATTSPSSSSSRTSPATSTCRGSRARGAGAGDPRRRGAADLAAETFAYADSFDEAAAATGAARRAGRVAGRRQRRAAGEAGRRPAAARRRVPPPPDSGWRRRRGGAEAAGRRRRPGTPQPPSGPRASAVPRHGGLDPAASAATPAGSPTRSSPTSPAWWARGDGDARDRGIPSRGATDQVVRTVTENSRTLKFTSQGFESE